MKLSLRMILLLIVVILLVPLSPMLISGRWGWWEAWAFAGTYIGNFVISRGLAARRHPDLLEERVRSLEHEDTEPLDKILAPALVLLGALLPIVAGIEAWLVGSDPFSWPVSVAAVLAMAAGYGFGSWALVENRFFSGTIRIQEERGHEVCTTGPYRIVRHPGYAGALLGYVVSPLVLDSLWAFVPAAISIAVFVVRIVVEERTLVGRLAGYEEYTRSTRYRLVPGVW